MAKLSFIFSSIICGHRFQNLTYIEQMLIHKCKVKTVENMQSLASNVSWCQHNIYNLQVHEKLTTLYINLYLVTISNFNFQSIIWFDCNERQKFVINKYVIQDIFSGRLVVFKSGSKLLRLVDITVSTSSLVQIWLDTAAEKNRNDQNGKGTKGALESV